MRGLAIALLLAATAAHADDEPWTRGVSAETRAQADAIFTDGNDLFVQGKVGPAIAKYREALALWDHPAIHLNLAVALNSNGRVLEAADELDRALRYGDAPLGKEKYQLALGYKDLFASQVGSVEASCTQAGTHVLLDGKPWFDCPGTQTQRVQAGVHAVGGQREGYVATNKQAFVTGGATAHTKIELVSLDQAVKLEYPYPRWLAWSIAGAGAAVVLGGAGVWQSGRTELDQYEADVRAQCPCEKDLSQHPFLLDEKNGARLKTGAGITMMVVGGAGIAAGIVMAILDRPHRVLPVEVAPTPNGVMAFGRF